MQRLKNDLVKTKKFINIARPLELPPLKLNTNADSPVGDVKKKPALPLFGKKRTFGFGKPVAAPVKPPPKVIKIDDLSQEKDVEEFEDDEEIGGGGDGSGNCGDAKNTNEATSEPAAINEKHEVSKITSSSEVHKITASNTSERKMDSDMDVPVQNSSRKIANEKSVGESSTNTSNDMDEAGQSEEAAVTEKPSSKRKRNRYRHRTDKGRETIDMDDIEEPLESDKYSKWVPPENQSGDGITDLNTKYGY